MILLGKLGEGYLGTILAAFCESKIIQNKFWGFFFKYPVMRESVSVIKGMDRRRKKGRQKGKKKEGKKDRGIQDL